ncbi:hypothetical protein DFH01_22620 [Falsiroseomonas bella]|uniref:Uncharacterized protein n=1 Tax=Falsiroseomonas bella TaxID=2184016 RepID=A0A317FC45_9PROT|nr:hypothetical protein [Falsiroseomonas bella]PWS35116.1 hypothetical protein DFH01_22620 [Falsiroseomonas bella]
MHAEEGASSLLLRHASPQDAAESLAALCGIAPENFSYAGPQRDPALHGINAMLARCRHLQLGGRDWPSDLPRPLPEDVKAYRSAAWLEHLRAIHAACLAGRPRLLRSPLHHRDVPVLGEVLADSHQIYLALHDRELFFFVFVGRLPQGVYYPARDLFLMLRPNALDPRNATWRVLRLLLPEPQRVARFVARALAGALRLALVVGDPRPGHYLKESLAYLDAAEADIIGFRRRGGLLVLLEDWCAMDPLAVIPTLAEGPVQRLQSTGAALALLDAGVDAHRVYRFKTAEGPGWLRRRFGLSALADPARGGRFRLMLSVDAERARLLNQAEVFRFVLRRLGAACAARGLAMEVAWDGWTISGEPTEKDRMVMARIEAAIAAIKQDLGVAIASEIRLFGRSAYEKVAEIAPCDLVLTTQGTGALLPSWLLERPTIVYHVAAMVPNRSDLHEPTVVQLDQRAVIEEAEGDAQHGSRFTLALWGVEDALLRAVGEKLGLEPELLPPPFTGEGRAGG